MKQSIVFAALSSVLFVVTFALPLSLSQIGHAHTAHCPLVGNGMSVCASVLDHIDHWQTAFAGTLAQAVLLLVATTVFLELQPFYFFFQKFVSPVRVRRARPPDKPTLLQELFAQGLLNPRIP